MNFKIPRLLLVTLFATSGVFPREGAARDFPSFHRDEGVHIEVPIADDQGRQWLMQGHICRPAGIRLPRLVVINHGSPARASDRLGMSLENCESEAIDWFVHRNYAVVLVLRLGYGATGGPWTESYEGCDNADYYRSGLETARKIKTIVDYVVKLPSYKPNGVIVVG